MYFVTEISQKSICWYSEIFFGIESQSFSSFFRTSLWKIITYVSSSTISKINRFNIVINDQIWSNHHWQSSLENDILVLFFCLQCFDFFPRQTISVSASFEYERCIIRFMSTSVSLTEWHKCGSEKTLILRMWLNSFSLETVVPHARSADWLYGGQLLL